MSDNTDALRVLPRFTVACLLVAFLAVLGAILALILTDHDTQQLVTPAITLAGLLGLGAHQAKQSQTIRKIDKQTNGVLTGRIKSAVAEALSEQSVQNKARATTRTTTARRTATKPK